MRHFLLAFLFLSLFGSGFADPIKIGVLSFQDAEDPLKPLKAQAEALRPARVEFAIGTYRELAYWIDKDLVEVAAISPGLYKRLPTQQWEYLGSGKATKEAEFRSVLVVRKDSGVNSVEDLRGFELLAVDPISVSGYINPVTALKNSGLDLPVRFTHSHSNSLRYLAAVSEKRVACVWEPTWKKMADPQLQALDFPELAKMVDPPVVLVGRRGLQGSETVKATARAGKLPGFVFDPDYDRMIEQVPPSPYQGKVVDRVGLEDLILTLRHYNRTHPEPARLGVVLTGGGAKCSYQAGAVRALEERLEAARQRFQDPDLDIHLVVGTSGGAINALSVAMGLSRTSEGFQDLRAAWIDLDQREIVSPPLAVRINMWFWFAAIGGLAIVAIVYYGGLGRPRGLMLTAVIGVVAAIAGRLPLDAGHFWTWISFGIEGAGVILSLAAVVGWALSRRWSQKRYTTTLVRLLTAMVAVLPLLQTWTLFWHEEVISENRGLEAALTRNFGRLIVNEARRRSQKIENPPRQIAELSKLVFDLELLERDLVLTASPLTDPRWELPGEFYFYAGASDPEFGPLGVSLKERPELLFDAMLGSAAIYPLFPSRHVSNLPQPGQEVELVDGSFAHRSPLEAAVRWGATHVLVIEASTQEVAGRGKLLHNFGAALTFMYDQAQLIDVRLEDDISLYTLYPSIPHIGLLDFSAHLIQGSLEKGYHEALGAPSKAGQEGGAWHKALGPPAFWSPE